MASTPRYRPHIDGLRAVAVLSVLIYHAFPRALPGGFVGVDIFFVISGFLITGILVDDFAGPENSLGRVLALFYGRRIRRIFPALLLVLAAVSAFGFLFCFPAVWVDICAKSRAAVGFYLNFVFAAGSGYFDAGPASSPLLHLWSLSVEEQFYLAWPFVIWICRKSGIRLLPVAVFLAGCSYCWNAQKGSALHAAAFYLPQMRFWELGVGSIGAILFPVEASDPLKPARPHRLVASVREGAAALGLILVLVGVFVVRSEESYPNQWALLPTVGALLLVCSSPSAWINRRLVSNRLLVAIGLVSYPLYLWHWPVLQFASSLRAGALSNPEKGLLLGLSLLLAGATYWLVERPIRRTRSRRGWVVGLLSGMGLIALGSWYAERHQGFPGRFSPALRQIVDFKYDRRTEWREGAYFLDPGQDERDFHETPEETRPNRPTLFLWGDSYAAGLYPGLRELYGDKYNIVQRTAALTGPIITSLPGRPDGGRIAHAVFAAILRRHPDVVILGGRWEEYNWKEIANTIAPLRAAGIARIILVGPEPEWAGGLKEQMFNYIWTHPKEPVPTRLAGGVDISLLGPIDQAMRALADQQGIEYVSPLTVFGGPGGFLARTGPRADSLTAFDGGHLTTDGSRYLIAHFPRL